MLDHQNEFGLRLAGPCHNSNVSAAEDGVASCFRMLPIDSIGWGPRGGVPRTLSKGWDNKLKNKFSEEERFKCVKVLDPEKSSLVFSRKRASGPNSQYGLGCLSLRFQLHAEDCWRCAQTLSGARPQQRVPWPPIRMDFHCAKI